MFLLHAVAQLARERECCDESGNKENRLPPFTECSNATINFSVHIESILKFVVTRLHFSHGLYQRWGQIKYYLYFAVFKYNF